MHTNQQTATLAGATSARRTGLAVALIVIGLLGTALQLAAQALPALPGPAGVALVLHDRMVDHSTARLTSEAARLMHEAAR